MKTLRRLSLSVLIIIILVFIIIIVDPLPRYLFIGNDRQQPSFAGFGTYPLFNNSLINHRLIFPISANHDNNRQRLLKSSATIPHSFLVVEKSIKEGAADRVDNLTKSTLMLKINQTYYDYTKNKNQLSNFENKNMSLTPILNKGTDIALVAPTFTASAYDSNSFYTFYKLYTNTPIGRNVTSNLSLLSRNITSQDTARASIAMLKLVDELKWITPHSHITILSDPDVDIGSLFNNNGNNMYDLAILGHQEYVTQREYDNLKKFVTNGGTMILLDGNVFFAEVKYDNYAHTITLVNGHWWAFNGKSAWKSVGERWANETSQWVGSNYLCYQCVSTFGNDPFEYIPHEEQYITNHNDTIVLNYNASGSNHNLVIAGAKPVIATYELNYQKGRVIALGIFSDDVITNNKFDNFFHGLLLKYTPKLVV